MGKLLPERGIEKRDLGAVGIRVTVSRRGAAGLLNRGRCLAHGYQTLRRNAAGSAIQFQRSMTCFVFAKHISKNRPQPLGGQWREDDPVAEVDGDGILIRHIPGLICSEKQIELLTRALHVHDVGKVRLHVLVVPLHRRGARTIGGFAFGGRRFGRGRWVCWHDAVLAQGIEGPQINAASGMSEFSQQTHGSGGH